MLRANDIPVAIDYNLRYRDTVYAMRGGFDQDEQWNKYSVGSTMQANSIRQAIADGYHTFDLLRGDFEYKRLFGGIAHQNYRFRIYHSPLLYCAYQSRHKVINFRYQVQQWLKR